jgi:hypothetical protein
VVDSESEEKLILEECKVMLDTKMVASFKGNGAKQARRVT